MLKQAPRLSEGLHAPQREAALPRSQSRYRADVDGLRALAVVAVIFYHLEIPGFGGGLVGVDIFFVVSGFVITRLLCDGFADRSLTLLAFYERRVRRLAPALMIVLLASFPAAFFLLLPYDFEQFSKSLLATVLFVSNLFFARQHGDYFASDAISKPLLHTWSLAVEEQFYMLYPALLFLLLRSRFATARIVTAILVATLLLSFALACVGGRLFPAHAFFLLPTRIWELMLGALIAQAAIPPAAMAVRQVLSGIGLVFIASDIAGIRLISADIVPQPLLACLGTALVIHADAGAPTVARALLSLRPAVALGLMSYALYLWHWPIIVFYRYLVARALDASDAAMILGITIAVSIASWRYIEQPIRQRRMLNGRPALVAAYLGGTGLIMVVAAVGIVTRGLPERLPQSVVRYDNDKHDINPERDRCIGIEPADLLAGSFCRLGTATDIAPSFALWGDSQTDPWMPAFNGIARESGVKGLVFARGGCPPLLGVRRVGRASQDPMPECVEHNNTVLAALARLQIKKVVLVGRWSWYIHGLEKGGEGAVIANGDSEGGTTASRQRVFQRGIAETVARLRMIGAQVWIIDEPPSYDTEVPKFLAYSTLRGIAPLGRSRQSVHERHAFQLASFRETGAEIFDLTSYLCPPDAQYCQIEAQGRSLYSDTNHLSVFGAGGIARDAKPIFKTMITGH